MEKIRKLRGQIREKGKRDEFDSEGIAELIKEYQKEFIGIVNGFGKWETKYIVAAMMFVLNKVAEKSDDAQEDLRFAEKCWNKIKDEYTIEEVKINGTTDTQE